MRNTKFLETQTYAPVNICLLNKLLYPFFSLKEETNLPTLIFY